MIGKDWSEARKGRLDQTVKQGNKVLLSQITYIGMPSASYAASPGSNPGEGDKTTT